jgi:type IV pilus assembly protein PilY1
VIHILPLLTRILGDAVMSPSRLPLNRLLRMSVFGALMLALPGLALSDDIDLYTGAPSNGGKPDLLITMDNAAAWDGAVNFTCPVVGVVSANNASKAVGFEQCALYMALNNISSNQLLNGKINMGLMLFDPSSNGALFKFPTAQPYPLQLMDSTGIPAFQTVIKSIDRTADKSNNSAAGGGMQEMWAYYASKTGLSGTKYKSPLVACQKAFVIYIANANNMGKPQDGSSSPSAQSSLAAVSPGGVLPSQITIPLPYNKYQANWGDEWARYMNNTDLSNGASVNKQNIITYTIAVTNNDNKGNISNPDYVQFVQSMASNGGGKSFVVNTDDPNALNELVDALNQIFNEVQAVNSVFAAVSLPVSVNGQGNYLNQIYVGMFRPDANALPRWAGNLKQYQLGFDSLQNVQLEDSNGKAALNSSGGFLSPNATSFWTSDTKVPNDGPYLYSGNSITTTAVPNWPTNGFWSVTAALPAPPPLSAGGAYDSPDGELVEKGGVGESMRIDYLTSRIGRTVSTCTGCTNNSSASPASTAMQLFDTSNTTLLSGTSLGSSSTTPTATSLINWVRGDDNTNPNNETEPGPGGSVTVRPSIHGDVLHSRPTVVNYGALASAGSPNTANVVVYYGSNDGMFHAINGNQTAAINNVRPGGELWSFVAPEFFGKFQRLYNNSPVVKLYGSTDPTAQPKDYFFDGTTTVYQDLRVAGSPKVYIYLTVRRGGRFIYALDVTTPTAPAFLWKKSYSDISELGQTWSQPKVARVKGYANPVLIMGGGYDPAEDSDPAPTSDSMGRAIIVLDAITGTKVWTACPSGCTTTVTAMNRAIPADITLLDRNGDGYIDRLYAADLGGNIWRVDLEPAGASAPSGWQVTELASLGGSGNNARKFFYPPDVTPTSTYDAVLAASGDREHPLYSASTTAGTAYNVVNRFYMLKDPNTGNSVPSGWTTITEANLTDETGLAAGTTPPYSSTSTTSTGGLSSGFYITFSSYQPTTQDAATHTGEKAVNAPVTVAGYTYFGTNTPDPAVGTADPTKCYPNLGTARGYAINFLTGEGLNSSGYIVFAGGGLPPSPVFGLVSITPPGSTVGVITPVLFGGGNQTSTTGADSTSSLGVQKVAPPTIGKRKRTYWFTEGQK